MLDFKLIIDPLNLLRVFKILSFNLQKILVSSPRMYFVKLVVLYELDILLSTFDYSVFPFCANKMSYINHRTKSFKLLNGISDAHRYFQEFF